MYNLVVAKKTVLFIDDIVALGLELCEGHATASTIRLG